MNYETIEVKPVTVRIGAEIFGIDLSQPLSNRQVEEVHASLMEHQVIFFRDQHLDHDSHKRLGRYFGELAIHSGVAGLPDHPEVVEISRRRQLDLRGRRILAFGSLLQRDPADGEHPLSPHRAAGGWRHPVRQHVCRLRRAVAADEDLSRRPHRHPRRRHDLQEIRSHAHLSDQFASDRADASRHEAQMPLHQRAIRDPHQRSFERRERRRPRLSQRGVRPRALPCALPLAAQQYVGSSGWQHYVLLSLILNGTERICMDKK